MSYCVWLTGLPSSGKTTIAKGIIEYFDSQYVAACLLDGDILRKGLCQDLGFSPEDRKENIRRAASVARLLLHGRVIVIAAFISPYQKDREMAKDIIGHEKFLEVFVKCSPNECHRRDVKGLYRKAKLGEIKGMTGFDAPYEDPINPFLVLDTEMYSQEETIKKAVRACILRPGAHQK